VLEEKVPETLDLMNPHGYIVWADTFINTIFVDREAWGNRRERAACLARVDFQNR
jgi:hypothetical protein